jgi:hypothetical protein
MLARMKSGASHTDPPAMTIVHPDLDPLAGVWSEADFPAMWE